MWLTTVLWEKGKMKLRLEHTGVINTEAGSFGTGLAPQSAGVGGITDEKFNLAESQCTQRGLGLIIRS
jgi:hypothetical protein